MEFISDYEGNITLDPDQEISAEELDGTLAAMELFRANADRVRHFQRRATELGLSGHDAVITVLNVDDPNGGVLAEFLMPGHNWQDYRDAGEVPVARGLAPKADVAEFLEAAGYKVAAGELAAASELQVVVMDSDTALVLHVEFEQGDN